MIFAHFETIKDDPGKFLLWILTSIGLSLSSFWVPILVGKIIGQDFYCLVMANNPFITFSIIFLSNSILFSINHIGGGSTKFAVSLRGIALVLIIMYLVLLSAIIPLKLLNGTTVKHSTQFTILIITICLGIYIYGFRDSKWEKSVDEIRKKEDEDIDSILNKADSIHSDNEIKL